MSIEYRHGSSPGVLSDLLSGSVACVLTDPPYGTGRGYGRADVAARKGRTHGIKNDADLRELAACAGFVRDWLAEDGVALIFMGPTQRRAAEAILGALGLEVWGSLPWDKGAPGLSYEARFCFEECLLATHPGYDPWESRGQLILPIRYARVQNTEHPNEKPIGLLRRYLRWACPNGGLVVDAFAGIASGALAAHAEGCDWIGAECDEQWWPIAERRIAGVLNRPHAGNPPTLFEGDAA